MNYLRQQHPQEEKKAECRDVTVIAITQYFYYILGVATVFLSALQLKAFVSPPLFSTYPVPLEMSASENVKFTVEPVIVI